MLNVINEQLKIIDILIFSLILRILTEIISKFYYKSKFILTTRLIFIISFCLYILLILLVILGLLSDFIRIILTQPLDQYGLLPIELNFFYSVSFYLVMPIVMIIFNFRKIETEEEKKSVSGFYLRYFSGLVLSLFISFLVLSNMSIGSPDPDWFVFLPFLIFIFYLVSIFTLKKN